MAELVVLSPVFPLCTGGTTNIQDCDKGHNLTFPGPLMSNKMRTDDLICFIWRKSMECLLHHDEPDQKELYCFWRVMELFCKQNRKVMMSEVAVVLFRAYCCLRKKESKLRVVQSPADWCLSLAHLLCSALPEVELRKAVIEMGHNFANKGLMYAGHLCYIVAHQESGFDLFGCESLPEGISAKREVIERTEVCEYMQSLTSGFIMPNFQKFKFLYACMLSESGLSDQALDYCETIARTVATFPDRITDTLLDELIHLSEKLHEGKGKEPEWLLNLRLLRVEEAAISNSWTEQEQHTETPPTVEVPSSLESYSSRAQEHRAFSFLTEEVTSQYTIRNLLGHGGGGAVYEGVRKADRNAVAIKFIIIDDYQGMMTIPGETEILPVEVALMKMTSKPFRSPYVLELLEWFLISKYVVLILERPRLCMDLLEYCKLHGGKLPETLARYIMKQMVQAAHHCCDCGVFHNDIKPENILINMETLQVKLIDFGSGDLLKDTPYNYCPGTPEYHPPEWYRHKQYLGLPVTVWTLGISLYQMICGDVPFQTRAEIVDGCLHFPSSVSEDCRELITWCLQHNPKFRPTFHQILRHGWFKAEPSYIQSIPVFGWLVKKLLH